MRWRQMKRVDLLLVFKNRIKLSSSSLKRMFFFFSSSPFSFAHLNKFNIWHSTHSTKQSVDLFSLIFMLNIAHQRSFSGWNVKCDGKWKSSLDFVSLWNKGKRKCATIDEIISMYINCVQTHFFSVGEKIWTVINQSIQLSRFLPFTFSTLSFDAQWLRMN